METTFITIHDLSHDARILYSSDSIVDILGHTPDEVVNRSSWDFFHPDELPLARERHSRGVKLDKAAVLSYCQLRNREGRWVWCECCFSVVYDVMVVCTSIYRRGMTSQKRAVEAPVVRRLFSSSPKDPRYHMLSHLSSKFTQAPEDQTHEPRAALFLNRFTRTLTVMYATAGIEQIVGISGEEMRGQSFYYCIQQNCLQDAVNCMESAKGNDSIAYLRFWFQDPRTANPAPNDTDEETDTDVSMTDATSDGEEDTSGPAHLSSPSGSGSNEQSRSSRGVASGDTSTTPETGSSFNSASTSASASVPRQGPPELSNPDPIATSRTSSGDSSMPAVFDPPGLTTNSSSNTSPPTSPASNATSNAGPIEIEAVLSCTSDGLVVCLRRARPLVPQTVQQPPIAAQQPAGLFAAPWAVDPVFVPARPGYQFHPIAPTAFGPVPAAPPTAYAGAGYTPRPHGPPAEDLFNSIRDVAVFAWALTGINGGLAEYARNPQQAAGESQPPEGFPVWEGEKSAYGAGRSDSGPGDGDGSGNGSGGAGGFGLGTAAGAGVATPTAGNPYPSPGSRDQ